MQNNCTAIQFDGVSKQFKNSQTHALNDLSFEIKEGEFITILGSSGCGKTTLLKMINHLYEPDKGTIRLFGEDISQVDKVLLRRKIGYVIQQVGLFPHMTVEQNISVVPKLLEWDKDKIDQRVSELLEMVHLNPAEHRKRYPSQLSGGQQQRVGLARALAVHPNIMLLDEPFGAIDAITRTNLQEELIKIHNGLQKTFILVTHDINEAFTLGDRVMIMNEGKICQFDTPTNIMMHPQGAFVEELIRSNKKQSTFWAMDTQVQ